MAQVRPKPQRFAHKYWDRHIIANAHKKDGAGIDNERRL